MRRMCYPVLLLGIAVCQAVAFAAGEPRSRVRCGPGHGMRILDLNISPHPLASGQKIDRFRAVVQLDGLSECDGSFELREDPGGEPLARGVRKTLKPGKNVIEFRPSGAYRLRSREHCFQVVADVGGAPRVLDGPARFCARESRAGRRWTMK
ncbi:MAG TPA: hypothetical protein VNO43_19095 [Candidatus Eisenbacteria bacterium]|nr:hypothetical protein [Candidatus Eisenbacteria bacterium]